MGVHKPKKLNKEKILKKIITAILPGLVVAGFFVVANPTKKTSITAPVENGLVGYWKLDENPAIQGTEIRDSSPFGNHGTLSTNDGTANKSVEGKIARALSFDGVDDYVDCGNKPSLNITDAITIEAWVYLKTFPAHSTILNKGEAWNYGYTLLVENNHYVRVSFEGLTTSTFLDDTTYLLANQWYHLVGLYDGSAIKIFINGAEVKSVSSSGTITTNDRNLWIGREQYGGGRWTPDGFIDEVRIYNRGLSADEIKEHYRGGMRRTQIQ